MARVVTISFKEDDRDMKLFAEIKSKRDKSNFVKEAVEFFLQNKNNPSKILEAVENNKIQTIQEIKTEIPKNNSIDEINDVLAMFGG